MVGGVVPPPHSSSLTAVDDLLADRGLVDGDGLSLLADANSCKQLGVELGHRLEQLLRAVSWLLLA